MATKSVQVVVISGTGLEPAYTACAEAGDEFVNSGRAFIHVKNANATLARTVTINSQKACSQGFDHDIAVAIPGTKERMIGPFPKDRFNDTSEKVQITYSDAAADLTIAVIEVP